MILSTQNCKRVLRKTQLLFLILLFGATMSAQAADICVDDASDTVAGSSADCDADCTDGVANCDILDAVTKANEDAGADTIIFSATTFPASGGETVDIDAALELTDETNIVGPGSSALAILGSPTAVFSIDGDATGPVTISGLELRESNNGVSIDGNTVAVTLDSLLIADNNSDDLGGGVLVLGSEGAQTTITNCTIDGNTAANSGAGVFVGLLDATSLVFIEDSTISDNIAAVDGGGVFNADSTVTISNSDIVDNVATTGLGGGILNASELGEPTLTISDSSIANNASLADGGAGLAISFNGTATVTNSQFTNNTTGDAGDGAGIYLITDNDDVGVSFVASSLTVSDSGFSGNQSADNGGAIHIFGDDDDITLTTVLVADCSFLNNQSIDDGGALFVGGASVTISGSTFDGNTTGTGSGDHGGAIFNHDDANLTILTSTLSNNISGSDGGAIMNEGALTQLNIINSTLSGNLARSGSGGAIGNGEEDAGTTATLLNVTITNNQSEGDGAAGGGIAQFPNAGEFTISNSIIAGNFVNGVASDCATSVADITSGGNNLIGTVEGCDENTFDADTLNDQFGTLGSELDAELGDLTPSDGGDPANGVAPAVHFPNLGSPVIDGVDDAIAAAPDTDEIGVARPIDGDGDGTANADIGAVEAGCGDGVVQTGEDCDDAGESATCNATCSDAACGDGVTNATAGEECDDAGDSVDCNADCTETACGDGVLNTVAGEECEDGDTDDGDGCSSTCTDEFAAVCGDGILQGGETCDDGNTTDGDDCDSACQTEAASLAEVCGDGVLQGTETCEDGNTDAGDGCDDTCQIEESSGSSGCALTATKMSSADMAALAIFATTLLGLCGLRRYCIKH